MKLPPPFQKLKFDKDCDHFQVRLDHRGNAVTCYFLCDDEETLSQMLPHASEFWKKRASYFRAFREYAAVDLLEELNDTNDCGQDGSRPVTSEQVRKLLPVPFSIRFGFNGHHDGFYFEMAGGDEEAVLNECVLSVYGTLDSGIESGEVEALE